MKEHLNCLTDSFINQNIVSVDTKMGRKESAVRMYSQWFASFPPPHHSSCSFPVPNHVYTTSLLTSLTSSDHKRPMHHSTMLRSRTSFEFARFNTDEEAVFFCLLKSAYPPHAMVLEKPSSLEWILC